MKPLGCVHQRQAVFYRAYQLARAFQQLPKAIHHERMVIGQEHARPAHGVSTTRGTLTKTCVPSPKRECTENVPFTCRTRSSMLTRPRLLFCLDSRTGSNTIPESAMHNMMAPSTPSIVTEGVEGAIMLRSEEHTSELQSPFLIS